MLTSAPAKSDVINILLTCFTFFISSPRIMLKSFIAIVFPLFIFIIALSGCKDDTPDAADQFVGNYDYTLTYSGGQSGSVSGALTIKKLGPARISTQQAGDVETFYSVSGNTITEEPGQTTVLPISSGSATTAAFQESSTGTLVGNVLTVNGKWERSGSTTVDFNVVCIKK